MYHNRISLVDSIYGPMMTPDLSESGSTQIFQAISCISHLPSDEQYGWLTEMDEDYEKMLHTMKSLDWVEKNYPSGDGNWLGTARAESGDGLILQLGCNSHSNCAAPVYIFSKIWMEKNGIRPAPDE